MYLFSSSIRDFLYPQFWYEARDNNFLPQIIFWVVFYALLRYFFEVGALLRPVSVGFHGH
jgi:hypothetical protein